MEEQKQVGIFQKFKNAVKIKLFRLRGINKVMSESEMNFNLETDLDTYSEAELILSSEDSNEEVDLKKMSPALRFKNSPYIQHKRFSLSTLDSMVSLTSHAVKHIPKLAHHLYSEFWLDFHANNNFTSIDEISVHQNDNSSKKTESIIFNNPIDGLPNKEKEVEHYIEEEEKEYDVVSGDELDLEVNDSEFIIIEEEEEINPVFLTENEPWRLREMVFSFRRLADKFLNSVDSSETLEETDFNDISDLGSFRSDDTTINNIDNNDPFLIGWFSNRSDGLNTLINFVVRNEPLSFETSHDDSLSLHSNSKDTVTTNAGILEFSIDGNYAQHENDTVLLMEHPVSNHLDLYDSLKDCDENHQLMKYPYNDEFSNMAQEDKKSNKRLRKYSDDSLELIDLNVEVYMEGNSNTEKKKGGNCITDLLDDYMQ